MVNLIHRAVVLRTEALTPGMVRVVLGGDGLEGFVSTGSGDEYLRVWLPGEGRVEPVLPVPVGKNGWDFPGGESSPLRTYTVRAWHPARRELVIDMVLHDRGLAATWARRAAPGDVVGVNTPRGQYSAPVGLERLLLVSDASGLPAAARILEELPASVQVRAFLEVPDAGHQLPLSAPPGAEVHWLHGGNGRGPSRIDELVRLAGVPDGVSYVWVAGETRVTRAVRKRLRHELGLPPTAYKVVGYWTENAEEWEARYEALPADVLARLEAIWGDAARDEEDIEDEYDAVLEAFRL